LFQLLEGGAELIGAQVARIGNAIDPNDPATAALTVLVLGWLEAAQQVLAAGSRPHELQVLLSVATGCSPPGLWIWLEDAPGADRPSHGLGRHLGQIPDTNAVKRTLR
jgi:hypothetical protein